MEILYVYIHNNAYNYDLFIYYAQVSCKKAHYNSKKKILASSLSVFKMSVQVNDTIQNNEHVDVAET